MSEKISPFEFVNSITYTKKNLIAENPSLEDDYNPFLTNRALSYFRDTALIANEMNKSSHIDKKMQYDFYLNFIRPYKRFSKWHKKTENENFSLVQEYYSYSPRKTNQALAVLSQDQINKIKEKMNKGG